MKEFKVCENCKKAAFCHSTCGAMFGFCATDFEPCAEYTLYRKTSGTRDDIGLPYVFRTLDDFHAWCEDNEEHGARFERIVLPAAEYEVLLSVVEATEDLNPYEYDSEYVLFDSAVHTWLSDRRALVDYFREYERDDIAEAVLAVAVPAA